MPPKEAPGQGRAALPRRNDHTGTVVRDGERLSRAGELALHRLEETMVSPVANDAPLAAEWKDRGFEGADGKDGGERHTGGDVLLVHRLGPGS